MKLFLLMQRKARQRDQKKQRRYYSGKKKGHTLKTQVVLNKKTQEVICTDFFKGKRDDFRLFKESKTYIHPDVKVNTDTGQQGIQKIHNNSELPKKKRARNPLSKDDKKNNCQQAKEF